MSHLMRTARKDISVYCECVRGRDHHEDDYNKPIPRTVDGTEVTPEMVLDCPMREGNDAGAATIRDYLTRLLSDVWKYREGFSGKRPFGNSGWEHDLYHALAEAGFVPCSWDDYGSVTTSDETRAVGDLLVAQAIAWGRS